MVINPKINEFEKEIESFNILGVKCGTTGLCGGDSGHGSKGYFEIKDLGGTAMECQALESNWASEGGIRVEFSGDAELLTLIESLEFITKKLKGSLDINKNNYEK